MTDYEKQARDFLATCKATMEIKYVGLEKPSWDDKPHCAYDCTIKTPKGSMTVHFYDSAYNTDLRTLSFDVWERKYNNYRSIEYINNRRTAFIKFNNMKNKAVPTKYDILACLQKYEVGSMDDFMHEFGYKIKCAKDMTNFINTYNAVVEEYNNLCRIFTPEQMEMMREIQ